MERFDMKLQLDTIDVDGKTYGAGPCDCTIGGFPAELVACMAGDERRITTVSHAVRWFVLNGLSYDRATELTRRFVK